MGLVFSGTSKTLFFDIYNPNIHLNYLKKTHNLIQLNLILACSRTMKLNISGDICILSDFRHYTFIN
jgi:hypothetical protein